MNAKILELLNLPADASEQQVLDAVAAQSKKLSNIETARVQAAADEAEIEKKMRVGLTREQAVSVIRRQREYDAKGSTGVFAYVLVTLPWHLGFKHGRIRHSRLAEALAKLPTKERDDDDA